MPHTNPPAWWPALATRLVVPAGTRLWTIRPAEPFPLLRAGGTALVSRNRATAVLERYLANMPFTPTGDRVVTRRALLGATLSAVTTTADLTMAYLGKCPNPLVAHPDLDWAQGLVWPSTLDVPRHTMALFGDRCPAGALDPVPETTRQLDDAAGAALLTEMLDSYRVRVPPPDDEVLVFINYRSNDEKPVAHMLDKFLRKRLGHSAVFLDRRSIELGTDFEVALKSSVRACKVLIAVIGPHWEKNYDENGRRAIDDPEDWVRIEITEAFANGIPVVPILVGRSRLNADILPKVLRPIAKRQYRDLAESYTESHVAELADQLIDELPALRDYGRR